MSVTRDGFWFIPGCRIGNLLARHRTPREGHVTPPRARVNPAQGGAGLQPPRFLNPTRLTVFSGLPFQASEMRKLRVPGAHRSVERHSSHVRAPTVRAIIRRAMYRALALDLDGTLLNSGLRLSDTNGEAVRAAMERGVQIVLATARFYGIALRTASRLDV
ncbi:MAG: HAD family hydrolase, partial [bacterium]